MVRVERGGIGGDVVRVERGGIGGVVDSEHLFRNFLQF